MGKRHSVAVAGLARFMHVFDESAPPSSSTISEDATMTMHRKGSLETENALAGPSHPKRATSGGRTSRPPKKKRKTGLLGPGHERHDATGLVSRYTDATQVPGHLQKYFAQRKRFFSLYDEGCLLDEEGWYSVTPELIADQIAERCRCDTIIDAFCGVGGNTIAFAKTCQRVIAFDTSPTRLALARHNAAIYGVVDRIEFILGDFLSFARAQAAKASSPRTIDVVFLSPPWGGPEYISGNKSTIDVDDNTGTSDERHPEFSLANVQPVHGRELFQLSRALTPNVALYLPRNTNLAEVSALLETPSANLSSAVPTSYPGERVEVEEEWMGSKLKALTFYFGGLALGQEDLWDAPRLEQGGTTSKA